MPRLNGIDLCRKIRAHAALRFTPILLVSAIHKDSESIVQGLNAGADDYLESPYEPMRLIAKVAQLLERKRGEEQLRESAEALRRSDENYRFLADLIPQQVWIARPDGAYDYVNQRAIDYFGCRDAHLLGWGWQSMI